MRDGERQVSPTIEGIRRDHVARYEWIAKYLAPESKVIDFACGIGYGCNILAKAGHEATGADIDEEAIDYANTHYKLENNGFYLADGNNPGEIGEYDAAISLETIEHVEDPRPLLKALREASPMLIASVPNESVMPWQIAPGVVTAYHYRHYTRAEFNDLLQECGWKVLEWYGQAGPESEVEPDINGRTLLAVCERGEFIKSKEDPNERHIAILGLGPSVRQYLELTKRFGGRKAYCDETWCINALGDVFACDRIFHMDDVRIQQVRANAKPDSNIARMLDWLKTTKTPVVTSRSHPDYQSLEEFPLAEVLNRFPLGYFNNTAPYAVAYALWSGATKISLFGMDYTYDNVVDAEKGRACVEFWLGIAAEMGVEIAMPRTTSLMDAYHEQPDRFYGYDTLNMEFKRDGSGKLFIEKTERESMPTAEQIEASYDHSRPVAEQHLKIKD